MIDGGMIQEVALDEAGMETVPPTAAASYQIRLAPRISALTDGGKRYFRRFHSALHRSAGSMTGNAGFFDGALKISPR
jgi:hypothetical protein